MSDLGGFGLVVNQPTQNPAVSLHVFPVTKAFWTNDLELGTMNQEPILFAVAPSVCLGLFSLGFAKQCWVASSAESG